MPGAYVWLQRKQSFDYLQAFIDAGKQVGLDVYAAINTMVGGKECPYGLGSDGPLFDGSISRDWATVVNTQDGLVSSMDLGAGTKFLNPANDEVVEYLLGILEDLAAYDIKVLSLTVVVTMIMTLRAISLRLRVRSLKSISARR